jgi:Zn-dependent M28 family amino/carboxypeptidase
MSKKKRLFSRPKTLVLVSALVVLAGSTSVSCTGVGTSSLDKAVSAIDAEELAAHTKTLGSDEFEGRFPGTAGEEKTVLFLEEEFRKIGTQPGNGDSYFQEVPMVEITASPEAVLKVSGQGNEHAFSYGEEFVALTLRNQERVTSDSQMVFMGYGIVAPEYGWNDYEGVDVNGKTVVMLVNDPGFATEDPSLFKGRAMTYYGRWTYKYEEAARQGASGVLLVHETEPAAYGWGVVKNSNSGPQLSLETADGNASRCAIESWISLETATTIFQMAGLEFAALKEAAQKPGFQAVPLNLRASVTLENTIRRIKSRNVAALIPGGKRADEYIIYTAHWDHFGRDPNLEGDQIYNGALDNATGTSGLIELAQAFLALEHPTERSILFLAVTAEEQGLLGSAYYAGNPIHPLTKTAAVINLESLNIFGRMKDVRLVGYGQSELDEYIKAAAREQDRVVLPNPTPEKGSFFRSDHFPFAKQGVPALYASSGIDHREKGEEWGRTQREDYARKNYHKPSDEFDPDWDLTGAVEDIHLLFKVGYRLAMETAFPQWNEGSEFKAKRDADMSLIK